ncbi:MAG: sugar phosphate nucleotidyltransferase [Thermoplasmatota archaeon]
MKAVILAAGEGKRMHPLTYTQPKVMLPVAGRPLLEWNILRAKEAGIRDVVLVVGYKSGRVRDYFGDGAAWDVSIEYVNQGEPRGTGHAVAQVKPFVDDFLVLCGDTIVGTWDIQTVMEQDMAMGLTEVADASEYGAVETSDGSITAIHEKMAQPVSQVINAGIYHFTGDIFGYLDRIDRSPRGEYELTDAINLLAGEQEMAGITLQEWRDVGYPWDLLGANAEMLAAMDGSIKGHVEPHATLEGAVHVGENTRVLNGAYVQGPVYIGKGCKIGPNCHIRPATSIGCGCHVGNACEIKNSIVMPGSNVPHHNYVGDSVIGCGCNLGSGTKIANLRLDKDNITVTQNGKKVDTGRRKLGAIIGDNVQTGINAMLNVGTLVGNSVFIGPGALASGEIQPGSQIM